MKLLIITQKVNRNDPVLGFFHRWIEEFSKHYEKINVICLEKGEYDLPSNVSVNSLGKEEGESRIKYIGRFYKYILGLRKEYDMVFVHMNPIYIILGGMVWFFLNKPIFLWYTHKTVDLKLKIGNWFSKKTFSASQESFRLNTSKIFIMGHGIDTNKFKPSNKEKKYDILSNSRISKIKKIDSIINRLEVLKEKGLKSSLSIIGDAVTPEDEKYKKNLKKIISDLDLKNEVHWQGPVTHDEMPNFLNEGRIFINLSETGSMDKGVLEAMACGVIPLSSNYAFHNILNTWNLYKEDDRDLTQRLVDLLQGTNIPDTKELRQYIVINHSLEKLVSNLVKEMDN